MISALVEVPSVARGAEFVADWAGVASGLHVLRLNMQRHGMLVPGGVRTLRTAKPGASWLHLGQGEYAPLNFRPHFAYRRSSLRSVLEKTY